MENENEKPKSRLPVMAVIGLALLALAAITPVGHSTLLNVLVQIIGGVLNITPAFSTGTGFNTATIVASQPANISGTIVNNLGPVNKALSVTLTPATGVIAYGATSDITTMDIVVNGVSHTFLAGECVGGASLVCTTITPVALVSGTNTIDVIPTPNMLFDPAQSPIAISVSVI